MGLFILKACNTCMILVGNPESNGPRTWISFKQILNTWNGRA